MNSTTIESEEIQSDDFYQADNFPKGLTQKVVESISHIKNEPGWLTEFRIKAFQVYNSSKREKKEAVYTLYMRRKSLFVSIFFLDFVFPQSVSRLV